MFEEIFRRKKAIPEKLLAYGVRKEKNDYIFDTDILNGDFYLNIRISKSDLISTTLVEAATGEEYILYKTDASGAFVGEIRTAIAAVLKDISDKCCEAAVFKAEQSVNIIEYVRKKYGDELEYLWEKFPDNAVWRRKDNKKWYGALLTVSRRKLGIDSDEIVEIIDLREEPGVLEKLIDNMRYYSGWHMNKKHWFTVVLDGSVPLNEIYRRIDKSCMLAELK